MKAFVLLAAAIVTCASVPAEAQNTPPRVLFDIGATVLGGGSLGSADAVYTTPSGGAFTLFSTSQSWSAGAGVVGHLQIRLTPRVQLEVSESWTRPEIRSSITGDFEGAANTVATQTVHQFMTSGGLVLSFAPRGRFRPFARGAVSWMRHLSNDQTLYRDGVAADIGGGVVYAWADRNGHIKPYGLRADVFVNVRSGGLDLAKKSRVIAPGFSASFIFKL